MNIRTFLLVFVFNAASAFILSAQTVINIANYLAKGEMDATMATKRALDDCRKQTASKLIFPKAEYHFYPDHATERYLFISNNDEGLKRIIFPLTEYNDFEIDGQGSKFVFHGFVCPFVIERSSNVVIRNLSIDWKRTFHSEGTIKRVFKDSIDISFSPQFPYKVAHNLLFFNDGGKVEYPYRSLLEFDVVKRETAYQARDYYTGPYVRVKDIGNREVRLFVPGIKGIEGNIMVFASGGRLCPAVSILDSKKIKVHGINIYHAGGMGIIAQQCEDVEVRDVAVTPSPGSGRIISTSADATHFVNCTGSIKLENCLFENQEDDATNIHGVYASIAERRGSDTLIVKLVHNQQYGLNLFKTGDSIEVVRGKSLNTYHFDKVKSVERLNKEYTMLVMQNALPADIALKDAMAGLQEANVIIRNCTIRNNRARGVLLGTRGKILIEKNYFHTPGAAILFEGDARFWYEQAGVRDVLVTGNTFDNCNYGVWGNSLIQVGSGIEENERHSSRYNQGIIVKNNLIRYFDPRIANLYSVKGFVFEKNKLERTNAYPNLFPQAKHFNIVFSEGVKIAPAGLVK